MTTVRNDGGRASPARVAGEAPASPFLRSGGATPARAAVPRSLAAVFDLVHHCVLATTIDGCRVYSNPSLDATVGSDARLPLHTGAPPPYVPADQYPAYGKLLRELPNVIANERPYSAELDVVDRGQARRVRLAVTIGGLMEPGRAALALWLLRTQDSRPTGAAFAQDGPTDRTVVRGIDRLSKRELEVLGLLIEGWRVPSIARCLYVSEHTVRNHLKAIYRKLGAHSQQELIERLKPPQG